MDTLLQDVRFALRTLRKSPGFVVLSVICLAVGIGFTTSNFSVVDAALMSPYGFEDQDRLVAIQEANPKRDVDEAGPSFQNFRDLRDRNEAFSAVAAQSLRSLTLTDGEEPVRLPGATVTWNLFRTLGVKPILGRDFLEEEDRPGAPGTILLSHGVWTRRYGGDRSVVGRVIMVNSRPHTVIGVMPERFRFPDNRDLWIPITPIEDKTPRAERAVAVYARLKPGVSMERARAELAGLSKQLAEQYPEANTGWAFRLRTLREVFTPADVRISILAMAGAGLCVLLIACANVANLMLARATRRFREIAIRASLGAGRRRIVRQLLTEAVVISLAAGVFGILIAHWFLDLITASMPVEDQIPYYIHWQIDGAALAFALVASVLTGLLFGLAPALQITRGNLVESLKEGGRGAGGGRSRLRNILVVAEIALSLMLLVGASLFVSSFMKLQSADAGLDPAPIMTMRIYMPGQPYEAPAPKTRRVEDVVRRLEAIPRVVASAASNNIPISAGGGGGSIEIEGKPVPRGEEPGIFYTGVTAHWFKSLGVPFVEGRDFTDAEGHDSSGVAVVNQTMARRHWPDQSAVGQRFRIMEDLSSHWLTVIGVVRDYHNDDLDDDPVEPSAYLPYLYLATPNTGIVIRTEGNPAAVTAAARQAIRESDAGLPVFEVQTLQKLREFGYWEYLLFSWMFSTFGAIALLLAMVGIYGVIAYGVSQRTHEIGVRMALGAHGGDVLRLVLGQGLKLALIGIGAGLAGSAVVMQALRSILFNTSPTDPISFGVVALLLVATALLASYVPARRALAVQPMMALHYE
jgi:predicted permease